MGGHSMSLSKIKLLVKDRIIYKWNKRYPRKCLPNICCLYFHASKVMSQKVFNIHASISSKTESCETAEWLYRNAIAYVMSVASTHFLPFVKPSKWHCLKKELNTNSHELWDLMEDCYNNIFQTSNSPVSEKVSMIPVLPNLITSTDEVTIFSTANIIQVQEKKFLVARLTSVKNEHVNSGQLNNYTTEMSGDVHCRGVHVVINTTFTASGLVTPIFVVVYGLTPDKMPGQDIITIHIPGLTVGSDTHIYLDKEGYISFVRGNYDLNDGEHGDGSNNVNTTEDENVSNNDKGTPSKESRIAKIYRETVYHPFIADICQT